jgi:membrane associated rhomboid family serine protease
MTTKTFGRRGAAPRIASPSFQPARAAVAPAPALSVELPAEPSMFDRVFRDNKLIADIPFLTFGLILFLVLVFMLERRFAFDIGSGSQMSLRSLIAFGGTSRDLVVDSGQWWRIALAPILHSSTSHILGNSFALAFIGMRLEPNIGRCWFLLIFVVSAIGGVAGSLYGNEPGMISVGASGAITGLLAALFVMSFNPYADVDQQRTMRRTALRFGVPALAPLAWGASGGVDYFCHAGGALAGGAVGMVICSVWSHDSVRPNFARVAGVVALAGFAGALLSSGFAATRYPAYAAQARQFVRLDEMPTDARGAKRAAELAARYPKDPLAHMTYALDLANKGQLGQAEAELRDAIALARADPAGGAIRARAQALLAALLQAQGRHEEAEAMAAEACRSYRDSNPLKLFLQKAKVCG